MFCWSAASKIIYLFKRGQTCTFQMCTLFSARTLALTASHLPSMPSFPPPLDWFHTEWIEVGKSRAPRRANQCRDITKNKVHVCPAPWFIGADFRLKGMQRSTFQWRKGLSVKRGEAIQWMRGLVRIATGKAIQWRRLGHSVNRRTLKTEKLLSSSPCRKSALNLGQARSRRKTWKRKILTRIIVSGLPPKPSPRQLPWISILKLFMVVIWFTSFNDNKMSQQ